ncbi:MULTISPECIES: epoxide hydrolase family protein [unclassified Microbacterium]|uniref:epoxide hydrolase family protein n=1 Tax=unclassified Microbacterium TaxID=2609290 RepID=UPI003019F276
MTDFTVHDYRLYLAPEDIRDLQSRIDRTRWPVQLPGAEDWSAGTPVAAAQTWAAALRDIDWGAFQEEFNAVPQFVATIDGTTVHFLHVRSERPDAIPLLALHGWPGTPVEYLDLVAPLTDPGSPAEPAFHVVVPSHPGVGLSGPTPDAGWGVDRTARAYATLMAGLGYDRYLVQGGDHGAVLAPHVGRVDRDHVIGVHVNAATIGFMPMEPVSEADAEDLTDTERARLASIGRFMSEGNGYNVIQATRPQTIGYGLEDSPVALLTWMLDKIHEWTHSPDIFEDPRYRDRHLADVLIYWLTRTATSTANNVYAEYGALFSDPAAFENSGVPTAVIAFAEDISIRRFSEQSHTIVRWTDSDVGGHFAALEQPAELLADLRAFAQSIVS